MKRLIQSKYKIYSEFYKVANEKERSLLSFLIQSEIPLFKEIKNLIDYQYYNEELNVNINEFLSEYPECTYNGILYKAIKLEKDKLDVDNLENSIKKLIYNNKNEGWSKSKIFVNSLKDNLNKKKGPANGVMVRLEATAKGIDLVEFFEMLIKKYPDTAKKLGMNNGNLEELKDEQEVIISTPNNYKIYNLEEIKNKLLNIPEPKKEPKKRLFPFFTKKVPS